MLILGKVFRGLYLLTEDVRGVAGRDVLNHLAVILDGPGLRWDTVDERLDRMLMADLAVNLVEWPTRLQPGRRIHQRQAPLQYTSGSSPRSRRTPCDSAIPCGRLFPAGGRSPDRSGKSAG
jgi:hypothetical protein